MRALTVRQPWAWAIVHGGKDVENRSRNIAGGYRGPVAIHAAARYSDDWQPAANAIEDIVGEAIPPFDCGHGSETLGAFVGVVDLVDVHRAHPETHAFGSMHSAACCKSPWAQFDGIRAHLELANPRPLPEPIPARGRLGLWTPDADTLAQLETVMPDAAVVLDRAAFHAAADRVCIDPGSVS